MAQVACNIKSGGILQVDVTVNRGAAEDGPQVTKIVLGSKDAVVAEMLTPLPAESLADRYPLDPTKFYYPLYLVQGLTARKMTRFMHHEDALREGLLRKVERVEDGRFSNRVLYLEPTKKGGKEEQVFDTQMYVFVLAFIIVSDDV